MREIDRREFLKVTGAALIGASLAPSLELVFPGINEGLVQVEGGKPDFNDILDKLPEFPTLVKGVDDPQTKFIQNRVIMLLDQRDQRNVVLRGKVIAFSENQSWGDSMAQIGRWFYPFPIENNNGEIGKDTWAYAVNILDQENISLYMKPGVKGQIWGRLPDSVPQGHVTLAFAVNPHHEGDKTGGDPNVAPAVIIRHPGHPGEGDPVAVRVVHARRDGSKFGTVGQIFRETDNLIVRLAREEAVTVVDFDVIDPVGNQEFMVELGSDYWKGPLFSEDINRVRVEDVHELVPGSGQK